MTHDEFQLILCHGSETLLRQLGKRAYLTGPELANLGDPDAVDAMLWEFLRAGKAWDTSQSDGSVIIDERTYHFFAMAVRRILIDGEDPSLVFGRRKKVRGRRASSGRRVMDIYRLACDVDQRRRGGASHKLATNEAADQFKGTQGDTFTVANAEDAYKLHFPNTGKIR
jgi:hypothetical protein